MRMARGLQLGSNPAAAICILMCAMATIRKLFSLDEALPDASNYARRGGATSGFLAGATGVGDAMMARIRSACAFLNRPSNGRLQGIGASLAVLCLAGAATAQQVPIPDDIAQIQVKAPSVVAPPVATPPVFVTPPVVSQQVPPAAPPVKKPLEPVATASAVPGQFVLVMHDGTSLTGFFGETKAVPFDSIFGKVEIPMTSIRTLDFAVTINGAKTHRVHFVNGDMLTGNVGKLDPMKFQTRYGMIQVEVTDMLRFSSPTTVVATVAPEANQIGNATAPAVSAPVPVPIPDEPPGPIRPRREIVADEDVR
jgi:hypothetical protein